MSDCSTAGRILIVDDDATNIELLSVILAEDGLGAVTARSGAEALLVAEREAPDLILLDIMMPGLDGYEVCARLKASPLLCEIPVIFTTARTAPEDIVKGLECGAADYVTKPFNFRELLARVAAHVSLKRARDAHRELIAEQDRLIAKLQEAATEIRDLRGIIPICASCKNVRDDAGYWQQIEVYVSQHSEADFTHGICPTCLEKLYPGVATGGDSE